MLARVLRDVDLAEEAVQEAFVVALERWPRDGVPDEPAAWIARTARRKAIDRLRRAKRFADKAAVLAAELERAVPGEEDDDPMPIPDDRLALIFACCHPALALEARVGLTLRLVGGLQTPEVARAFLVSETTMQQRVVRAKRKLRDAGIAGDEAGPPMSAEYRVRDARTGRPRWVQVVGRALPGPDGRPARVVGVSLDVTESRDVEERQRLLMREVDHRAKNALAVALSVVQLAPRDVPPDVFASAVTGRIAAMARTHSLLAAQRWEGAELRALAEAELATHAGHVRLEGPAVRLTPDAAQPVAMLLHELATNAAKHGALSSASGAVSLRWWHEPAGDLLLRWEERGGPPVGGPPARTGFGSRLLGSLVERQLGGTATFHWSDPAGLAVDVRLPSRHLAAA